MQTDIRGGAYSTLDFDHYRKLAGILRCRASIDVMSGARPALLALPAAAVLLVAVIAFGSSYPVPGVARAAPAASAQSR